MYIVSSIYEHIVMNIFGTNGPIFLTRMYGPKKTP